MKPEKYVRKPFVVEAIRVTPENMDEVAEWCRGKVTNSMPEGGNPEQSKEKFIKVKVADARTDRQSKAFVGDWVLKSITGFKIYTPHAFEKNFNKMLDAGVIITDSITPGTIHTSQLSGHPIEIGDIHQGEITQPIDFIGLVGDELGGTVISVDVGSAHPDVTEMEVKDEVFAAPVPAAADNPETCPDAEFHTSYISGFYDPQGHHIKESRFNVIHRLEDASENVRQATKISVAARFNQ